MNEDRCRAPKRGAQAITGFEKGAHIREDTAFLQGREIEKEGPFETVAVQDGGLDYTAIFKTVSGKGS